MIDENAVAEIMNEVEQLEGVENFKGWLSNVEKRFRFVSRTDGSDSVVNRLVFTGPPRSGKTTAAHFTARLFHALGIIENSSITSVTINHMKSPYVGQSASKAQEILLGAKNGTLIIDELAPTDSDDGFAQEVWNVLLVALTSPEYNRTLFVFTGYKDAVSAVFSGNPGLKSKICDEIEF